MAYPTAAYDLLPKYNLARQGRIFTGNIAPAGVILPIYSNNTQQVGLWNPAGSDIDVVLMRIALTLVDTTGAAGGFMLARLTGLGAAVATGSSITAFTETTPLADYVGGAYASQVKFGQGATLTVVGASLVPYRHLGLNQMVLTPATTGATQWDASVDFDGDVVLTPGTAVFLAGNIANLNKWAGSVTWAEISRIA